MLVTDGRKRLFFRNEGERRRARTSSSSAPPRTPIRNTRRSGDRLRRAARRRRSRRGGALPSADAHEVEASRFAAETADELRRGALANEYQDLILVAPPQTLGQLRKSLHPEVEKRMRREIAKDVTGHPVPEIEKMLTGLE